MTIQVVMILISIAWVIVHFAYYQLLKTCVTNNIISGNSTFVKMGYYLSTGCILSLLFLWFSPYEVLTTQYKDFIEVFLIYFASFFLSGHHFVNNTTRLSDLTGGKKKWHGYFDTSMNILMQWFPTMFLPFFMTKFYSVIVFVWPA